MSQKTPNINNSLVFLYGLLALPLSFAGLPVYVHAPDFYATQMGLSLSVMGGVLMTLRIIDAVQDPVIGILSDRYHHWRKAIVIGGLVLLAGGFVMVFNPIPHSVGWFALSIFICTTGFSIVTINFHALGGTWRLGTHERTRVTTIREAFGLIGLLVASALPTAFMTVLDKPTAFSYLSYIFIPLIVLSAGCFFYWWRQAVFLDDPDQKAKSVSFKLIVKDRWNAWFFGVYALSNLASAIPAILVIFFIRDKLGAENLTGAFLLAYFLSGAAFMPVWHFVSKKLGKIQTWMASMLAACLTFVWAFFLGPGDVVSYGIICVLSGAALGADLALPPSILADKIDTQGMKKGASRYFAVLTFITKSTFAFATGLIFPFLALFEYQPAQELDPTASFALSAAYALIPCALKLGAMALIWWGYMRFNDRFVKTL